MIAQGFRLEGMNHPKYNNPLIGVLVCLCSAFNVQQWCQLLNASYSIVERTPRKTIESLCRTRGSLYSVRFGNTGLVVDIILLAQDKMRAG